MKILVVGGGAREHTLVWKIAQSPRVDEIYTAPGNAGTAGLGHNLDINPDDTEGLVGVAKEKRIELVVVGPEVPLANGIVDRFQQEGIPIFGPGQEAARIESSKVFAKELMQKYGIPCAGSVSFSDYDQAREYIEQQKGPMWVKADGLAAGKGAIFAGSTAEALGILDDLMKTRALGAAGDKVVIEESLSGNEMSAFAFTDGRTVIPMVSACDYKRIDDGDQGPNTGGMGSFSPPNFLNPELVNTVNEKIMVAAVRAMARENTPYRSVLY
ncbi:MAG: phosphoribosylamine--glycine ligase, partial [Dehalococcoidales bacterium]